MQKFLLIIVLVTFNAIAYSQESFTIKNYQVNVTVHKNASLTIRELINVHFTEKRHGIIRQIPYRYQIQSLPESTGKANRQLTSGKSTRIIIEDIKVPGWKYDVKKEGDYEVIKIGSENKYVDGDQQFAISYKVLNAINFFSDHSEMYLNIIGNQWNTTIDSVHFSVDIYKSLNETPESFVASGFFGSKENKTVSHWQRNKFFSGHTTAALMANEGLTVGIAFPKDFLTQPNYRLLGLYWLVLPFIVFFGMWHAWKRWGKDEKITVQTEFYPPENITPSVSGYIIDDKLDKRDLTALVPYWGANGYLKINEIQKEVLFGLIKHKEYEFVKLKDLPAAALTFENTLFNGIFKKADTVLLSDLKNVLYVTMNQAKSELEAEIDKDDFYVKYSRGLGYFLVGASILLLITGIAAFVSDTWVNLWMGISLTTSAVIIFIFGLLMTKKTKKGTELYRKLLGFKEFLKTVEKDRLQEFLKQDSNYFDKVLPYAIVFDIADTWKDKLKGLDIAPPQWYHGYYGPGNFNTAMFMGSLDNSMRAMSNNFYSSPGGNSSSGSSGGSFGGGGGFSGGGFGGGGGSSW